MADILIRGMEMPTEGFIEVWIDSDGAVLLTGKSVRYESKDYYTPVAKEQLFNAIELPEHGDLVDKKAVREVIDDIWDGRPLAPIGAKVLATIDSLPVIVPASKEETE